MWALDVLQEALQKRVELETKAIEELEKEKASRLTAPEYKWRRSPLVSCSISRLLWSAAGMRS
jgi:hypothetical protein